MDKTGTRLYFAGEDGQLQQLDAIEVSGLTILPGEEQQEAAWINEPVTVEMDMKVDSETARRLEEEFEAFMKKREAGIKAVAEHYGIPEDELRKQLEKMEKQAGTLMVPSVNPGDLIREYSNIACPEPPDVEILRADTARHQPPREYGISRQSWRRRGRR